MGTSNFDELVVEAFWATREEGSRAQGGSRSNVIAGKNLDGFLKVVEAVAQHCGIPDGAVHTAGKKNLTLPGYFRPTKIWDVVIVHKQRLLAVLEFKSQVGSFGNNFNNRCEEAIGSAADLWAAQAKGALHPSNHTAHRGNLPPDPRSPFLGYLMLLQDCEPSNKPVANASPHYHVSEAFNGASYAGRYRILCERLMEEGMYGAASLMLSAQGDAGRWRSLSDATSVRNLFTQLAARLLAGDQA